MAPRICKLCIVVGLCSLLLVDCSENNTIVDEECAQKTVVDEFGNEKTVTCFQVEHSSGNIIIKVRMYKNSRTKHDQIRDPRQLLKETNCSVDIVHTVNNCTIRVNNEQFLELHDAFATLYTINVGQHAAFLEVSTLNGSVVIGGLVTVRTSKISSSKFLPYTLARLPDIIDFKVSTRPQTVPVVNINMDFNSECISQLLGNQPVTNNSDKDRTQLKSSVWNKNENIMDYEDYDIIFFDGITASEGFNTTDPDYNPSYYEGYYYGDLNSDHDNQSLNYQDYNLNNSHSNRSKREDSGHSEDFRNYFDLEMNNTKESNSTESIPFDRDKFCFRQEDNETQVKYYCTAGHKMPSEQRDMIMMALYSSFFVNLDTVTITRREIVPVSDFEICAHTKYTMLYPAYVASLYAEYGLRQCCKLNMFQLEIYGGFTEHGIRQLQWQCMDPYWVTAMIQRAIIVICAIMTVFCPMMIRFLPSPREVEHSQANATVKRTKLSTNLLHRNNTLTRSTRKRSEADEKTHQPLDSKMTTISHCSLWQNQEIIYMNGDAVYSFGLRTILAYILLFHFDNYPIRVIRRVLTVFAVLSISCSLLFVRSVFFPFTLSNSYCKFEDCGVLLSYFTNHDYSHFMKYKVTSAIYVPAVLTLIQVICLSSVLFRKQGLSETFQWDEAKTGLGKFMQQAEFFDFKYKSYSVQMKLYKNFSTRLGYLVKKRFWIYLLHQFLVKTPQFARPETHTTKAGKCINLAVAFLWFVLKLPLVIIGVPLFTLPIFTIWNSLLIKPKRLLGIFKKTPFCYVFRIPIFVVGYFMAILTIGFFIYMSTFTTAFIVIDVVRNIRTSMPQMIFIVSIILYFRNAIVQFEDSYRGLKLHVFQAMLSLEEEQDESENLKNFPLRQDSNGDVAIPRSLFRQVSEEHKPYGKEVLKMLYTLGIHITIVSFLFIVVVDFQVLDQFSELGESFVTVITVSVPSLLGMLYSDGQRSLEDSKQYNRVRSTLKRLIHDKRFWQEQHNKAKRKSHAFLWDDDDMV